MNKLFSILLFYNCITIGGYSQVARPVVPAFNTFQSAATHSPGNARPLHHYSNNAPRMQAASMAVHSTPPAGKQHTEQLIRELQGTYNKYISTSAAYMPNPERTKDFPAALQHLDDMLTGKKPLSVADAYYTIENAYGNCYLTRPQYDSIINQSATFIKTWMQQNGLDIQDNYMVHHTIKKFMSEPMTITSAARGNDGNLSTESVTHQPFHYDYNDYAAQDDARNGFLTKSLATGYGQCASMPMVYLVLAEKMGVTAYLSLAPQHSFIKHPDNSGYIVNYEPTSNWELSDNWYKDNLFISADAMRSGLYLDTLNSRKIVANCMFDLAMLYIREDQTGDGRFIQACLQAGEKYYPDNNNVQALGIYSMSLATLLRDEIMQYNIRTIEEIAKYPAAAAWHKAYVTNETHMRKLGYQQMPAGLYEQMLQEHEFKGKAQASLNISGKEKRNLFITTVK